MSVSNYRCPKDGTEEIQYTSSKHLCPVCGEKMVEIPMPTFIVKCLDCGEEKETQYRTSCDKCGGEMVKKERYAEMLKRRLEPEEDEEESDEDDEEEDE